MTGRARLLKLSAAGPLGDMTWLMHIACRDEDPDLFVPDHGVEARRTAIAICTSCPVRPQCRDHMLATRPAGPVSIIAGGWIWNAKGQPRPHPADARYREQIVADVARRIGSAA